jgi:predicted dehydrogenase
VSRRFGIAILGCGIGYQHAQAYAALESQFALRAICDIDRVKAETVAQEFGVALATTDPAAAMAAEEIDIVDICTPPATHRALIEQALDAGKHVICEKPLVGSLADADAVIARAAGATTHVMPIFQYRFGNGFQKLLRLIERGVTGRLHLSTVETAWRRGADYYAVPWRGKWASELGGALLGHAIHAHDMLVCAAGPIASVFARRTTRVNPIETEDCAAASLEFHDGSLATLAVTLGSVREISRLRFCFENLVAESALEPYNPGTEPWSFAPASPAIDARIAAALADFEVLPERFAGQLIRFHRALIGEAALPVTLADARASLELVTALYHSAATSLPVSLPIGPGHPRYTSWR